MFLCCQIYTLNTGCFCDCRRCSEAADSRESEGHDRQGELGRDISLSSHWRPGTYCDLEEVARADCSRQVKRVFVCLSVCPRI